LFPFGFGLSYTRFEYANLALSRRQAVADADLEIRVSVEVSNTGSAASDEVVELYVEHLNRSVALPHHELRGYRRLHLAAGASTRVELTLDAKALSLIDDSGARVLEPGRSRIFIGGSQPDARSTALLGRAPLVAELELTGTPLQLPY
jgi:beta-glucosidase